MKVLEIENPSEKTMMVHFELNGAETKRIIRFNAVVGIHIEPLPIQEAKGKY